MQNSARKKIDGPLLVTPDQIEGALLLAQQVVASDERAQKMPDIFAASIKIDLSDGEWYSVKTSEDALAVPNLRKNPIKRIRIKGGINNPSIAIEL